MHDQKEGFSLNKIVGGILRALRDAKYLGDMESADLVKIYRKDSDLLAFSVPAFTISDVDIELRFSIVGLSQEQEKEGEIKDLKVNVSADILKGLEAHQVSLIKLKFSPMSLRVFEESK